MDRKKGMGIESSQALQQGVGWSVGDCKGWLSVQRTTVAPMDDRRSNGRPSIQWTTVDPMDDRRSTARQQWTMEVDQVITDNGMEKPTDFQPTITITLPSQCVAGLVSSLFLGQYHICRWRPLLNASHYHCSAPPVYLWNFLDNITPAAKDCCALSRSIIAQLLGWTLPSI
jgi:hypothetical protein